jgi:hypothetical protein
MSVVCKLHELFAHTVFSAKVEVINIIAIWLNQA